MAETRTLAEFRKKFRVDELLVLQNDSWSWSVRPAQPTLGSGILSLNRFALRLSDVTPTEMGHLSELVSDLEQAVESCFSHSIMNYLMLMMVDHHVHYHVVPRYEGERVFGGVTWIDNGWPALPVMADAQHGDHPAMLTEVQAALKVAI